jgi:hypothetical protein
MAVERFDSIADTPHHALLNYIYDYAESAVVTAESWAALYTMAAFTRGTIDPANFRSDSHQRFASDPLAVFAGDVQSILIQVFRAQGDSFQAAALRELAASPFWQARLVALWNIDDLLGKGYRELDELVLTKLVHDPDPELQIECRDMLADESYQFYAGDHQAAEAFRLLVSTQAFRRPAPPARA